MEKGAKATPSGGPDLAQAIARHRAGDIAGAIEDYRQLLGQNANDADILNNLGIALKAAGRIDEAVIELGRATALKPDNSHYRYNLGNALGAKGNAAAAEAEYRRVIETTPTHRGALGNLGLLLQDRDQTAAGALLARAVQIGPDRADAWHNLGAAMFRSEKWEAAVVCLRRSLALDGASAKTWCHLGLALAMLGRYEEAAACQRRALALDPGLVSALAGLGQAQVSLGRLTEGEANFQKAVGIDPGHLDARLGLARTLLLAGEFVRGWPAYEWRWKRTGGAKRKFDRPEWLGENRPGMSVLIHAEQGLGDAVHFLRYAPMVAAAGHQVILEVPKPLARLAATLPGISRVVATGEPLPAFERRVALLDLPMIFKTTMATIPRNVPYLHPTAVSALPAPAGTRRRIGVAWAGNPGHSGDRLRTASLSWFLALTDMPGTAWYSLQVGEARADLAKASAGAWIADLGGRFADFLDTANAIAALDLVLTVDTAVAHLAGALGKPVWVALPYAPDWRWMLEREDSPWYPTMRLFRQSSPGDWSGVFRRLHGALMVAAKGWTNPAGPGKTKS